MDIDNESKDNTKKGWKQLHVWNGSLIANMFQVGLEEHITKAVVLCHMGGKPIFWTMIMQGRTPLRKCQGCRIQPDRPHLLGW